MTRCFRVSLQGLISTAGILLLCVTASRAQPDLHSPFDKILDTYVRDGLVYYLALQKERAPLDRYLASLNVPKDKLESWSKEDQQAFWLNAYNAAVLRTVIDRYPIRGSSADYPPRSIRQILGAFDRAKHRLGGQELTLDQIEEHLTRFGDARLILALGRGALGSGRLRSEVYAGAKLDKQLTESVRECATRVSCFRIDRTLELVEMSPLFGWHEQTFVQSFASAGEIWANRSPIERAVAAMVYPHLFASEREFLALNTFQMKYGQFDWRLNDLTGGAPGGAPGGTRQ